MNMKTLLKVKRIKKLNDVFTIHIFLKINYNQVELNWNGCL